MIRFFRNVRQKLFQENRFSKYLLYALGEIVLVVIGILIALQINQWNQQRMDRIQERQTLIEIQENLTIDLKNIAQTQDFNQKKLQAIDTAFHYMSLMNDTKRYAKQFSQQLPIITNSMEFFPNQVAFLHLASQGQMDILGSNELRKQIAKYYSEKSLEGVQEQLKLSSQQFLTVVTPKIINKDVVRVMAKRDFNVQDIEALTFHNDPEILAILFVLLNKTKEHNYLLEQMKEKTLKLQGQIKTYLSTP